MLKIVRYLLIILLFSTPIHAESIYRVYNPNNGEHLYTNVLAEAQNLVSIGWRAEGLGWSSPDSGAFVYRLYHSKTGKHLYTLNTGEIKILTAQHGWEIDFGGAPLFISGGENPVYRLYNPHSSEHLLTTSEDEYNNLQTLGWNGEGVALSAEGLPDDFFKAENITKRILELEPEYPEDSFWGDDSYYKSSILNRAGWGCHGFALLVSDRVFGIYPGRLHYDKNNIKVGDMVRINHDSHTVIVLDIKVDNLTLVEGNYNDDIHWRRVVNKNTTDINYILTRYP